MKVLTDCAVKPWRSAATKSIFPECLNRALLDILVARESSEVEAGQVQYRFAVRREFGPGAVGALDDGNSGQIVLLELSEGLSEALGCPVVN